MVNKIYTLIWVLLFALPLAAQTPKVSIEHQLESPGTIAVPIHFEHFDQNITAITLNIGFDQDVLTFTGLHPDLDPDGIWIYHDDGGVLSIAYVGLVDISGQSLTLEFEYNGFTSPLDFLPGSEFETETGTIPPSGIIFVNGSVSMNAMDAHGSISLGTIDDVPVEQQVLIPIHAEGDGFGEVGAFSLKINYDPARLLHTTNILNIHPVLEEGGDLFINQLEGQIQIEWLGSPGTGADLSEPTKLLDMQFVFQGGGNALLDFAVGSEMLDGNGDALAVLFEGGAVNQYMPEGIELAIASKKATPGDLVQVPITSQGLNDYQLGSLIWKLQYDIQKSPYIGFTGVQLDDDDNFEVNQTASGELTITAFNPNGIVFENDDVLMLEFMYMGGGDAPITFLPGSQTAGLDGLPISHSYVNGGILPKPAGPDDAVAIIGKVNTLLDTCGSEVVHVPVTLENMDEVLGALTIKIGFTPGVLSFVKVDFADGQDNLENAVELELTPNSITLSGFDANGITGGGKLFDLVFAYHGGSSPVRFLPGTSFENLDSDPMSVALVDGAVTTIDLDVDLQQEYDVIKTITGTPALVPFYISYGDLATINPEILVDTRIRAEGGFPQGTEIESVIVNGLVEPVFGAVGGADEVLLSELLDIDPASLSDLHLNEEDSWIFIISGVDQEAMIPVHLEVFAYIMVNGQECSQVLSEAHSDLHFNEASLNVEIVEDAVCFNETIEIRATIEYPVIQNLIDAVDANALLNVTPALNAGAVISWDYNGVSDGEFVITEDIEQIYLSDIVGSQSPLSGHDELTDVWTFHLDNVLPGNYTIAVEALAQLSGDDYPYLEEDGSFAFREEPAVLFAFNEQVVSTDDELHYLDNEEVTVYLHEVLAGTGAITLHWVLNDEEPVEWSGLEGEVIFGPVELPVGTHSVVITHLADQHCEAINPEEIYKLTIVVEQSALTLTFDLTNVLGDPVEGAVITLNGTQNDPGDYVFHEVIPGEYSYFIELFCYNDADGTLSLTGDDFTESVMLENFPGDANGDNQVDISDVMIIVDVIFGGSPPSFCPLNADFNLDGEIDISDVMLTVDYIFSSKGLDRPVLPLRPQDHSRETPHHYELFRHQIQY